MANLRLFFLIFILVSIPVLSSVGQDWGSERPHQYFFNYKGNWSSTLTYESNDAVRGSDGKLYVGTEDNIPANINPVGSTRYWAEAISSRGNDGPIGPIGNSIVAIFIRSTSDPTLPTNPSYSSGTFSNLDSWHSTARSGGDPLWAAFYAIDNNNTLTYITHYQISGPRGPPGQSITGPKGDSIGSIFIRSASTPTLPGDNTGTRTGDEITIGPSGWSTTAEATSGNNDLYLALARLPGGNNTIDYFTVIKLSGEAGLRGPIGPDGMIGTSGTSLAFAFQRKTGASPSLPAANTGIRSGAELSLAPPSWSLVDPGGTDPLYMAVGILPGSSTTDITWRTVSKLSGEKGDTGSVGTPGTDGENGYSTRLIYRKSLSLDLIQNPTVTYDGVRPPDANSLTLPDDNWSIEPYITRSFSSFDLNGNGNTSPQALDYDEETDILFVLNAAGSSSKVFRYNNIGTVQSPDSFDLHSSNDTPLDLTVNGNTIRVLDGNRQADQDNPGTYFYQVFAYSKSDGGRQVNLDFNVTATGAGLPQGISLYGDWIYILTDTSVRIFDLTGVEQTNGGLTSLGSSNNDPQSLDINEFYLFILDATDNKIYIRERKDLEIDRPSREFTLDSDNTTPEGVSVSDLEVFIINTADDKVYRYYNPENTLWVSALFIQEDSPYAVQSTIPFWMTGQRGIDGTGTGTTIIHQSSSGSGTAGNSIDFVYRKSATELTVAPRVSDGTYENGRLTTAPPLWHLTAAEAILADSSDNPMYVSVVRLSGDGDTVLSYSVPLRFTGYRGPPGNSLDFVFRRDNTNPSTPIADSGTRNGQELSAAPSGWELEASDTTGYDPLYASIVTLPGSSTNSQRYSTPIRLTGPQGNSIRTIYQRLNTKPSTPSDGAGSVAWNPENPDAYRPPTGWSFDIPSGTQTIWASVVILPGESTTETYDDVFQMSGDPGSAGDSIDMVFQRSASRPSLPTGGTRTGNSITTAPGSWHLSSDLATGNDDLYISLAILPGNNLTSIIYDPPIKLTGEDGPRGLMGDSLKVIYLESATEPSLPSGGLWDGTSYTAPASWTENVPTRTLSDTETLWASIVELSSDGSPPRYTGIINLSRAGPPGRDGDTGIRGDGTEIIFQVSSTTPNSPINGDGTWNPETSSYTPPSPWSLDAGAYSGTQNLYAVKVTLPGGSTTETYGTVFQMNGRGSVGPRGPPGVPSSSSSTDEDGDSLTAIYKVSITEQDNTIVGQRPSGGSWNYVTKAFTQPSGWLTDIPVPLNNRFVYLSVVTLSGISNTISYDLPIQLNLRGPQGIAGNSVVGPQGIAGNQSGWIYKRGATKPTAPSAGTGQFFARTAQLPERITVPGWSSDPDSSTIGSGLLWAVNWSYDAAATTRILYGNVVQLEGPRGQRGIAGSPGQDRSGTGGADGSSSIFMFRTSASDLRSIPTGGSWVRATHTFTPPSGWYDTYAGAEAAGNSDDPIYVVAVYLSGTADTVNAYSHPIRMTGKDGKTGPIGPRGAAGRSIKGDDGRTGPAGRNAPNTEIQYSISGEVGSYENNVVNPYYIRFSTDGGHTWSAGHKFRQDGESGRNGSSFKLIFREDSSEPSLPTGGSWDGRTFHPPTNWSENAPHRPDDDPENLYATGVELPGGSGTPHYTGVFQISIRGRDGRPGSNGIRGDGTEIIFQVSSTTPNSPINGDGTWNPETNSYTPPSPWSLDAGAYSGTQNLYAVKVTLPGGSTTETYGTVFQMNGRGSVGPRGPPGVPSSSPSTDEDGDSLTAIYKVSTTEQDNTIVGQRPSGGSWNHVTKAFTQPSGWLTDIPVPLNNRFVYLSVVTLSGISNTISYDLPIQLNLRGPQGIAGNSVVGPQGISGISSGFLYRRAGSIPTRPTNGTGTYGSETITLSGWSDDPGAGSGLLYAVGWIYNPAGSTAADRIKYTPPFQMEGSRGSRGPIGPTSGPGPGSGNDGSSSIFMFRTSASALRSIPTGGSWVRSTHTFTPPSGWYDTYAGAEAAGNSDDPIYAVAVYLSGTADTVNAYSHPIRMTGKDGKTGPIGPRGAAGRSIKGDDGRTGPAGRNAPQTEIQYSISGEVGSYENNVANPYYIRFSTDGGHTWSAGHRFKSDGTNGTSAPLPQIEYSVDGTGGWATSVANPYFIRFSVDGGMTWSSGHRFRSDGTNGTAGVNGFGYQNYYHANTSTTVTVPHITYDGSAFSAQSGWATTIPNSPQGANVFVAPVRYQLGTAGQTVEGVVLFGTVPRTTAPPPADANYSNGIEYGIASGNTPSSTHSDSTAFSLAVGGTHTTEQLAFAATTSSNGNYYIRLPAGLVLTRAVDSVQGDETSSWSRVASSQVWIYQIGFAGAENTFTFTIRRDN